MATLVAAGRVDGAHGIGALATQLLRVLDDSLRRLWLEVGSAPEVLSLLERVPARGEVATDLPCRLRAARLRAGLTPGGLDKAAGLTRGRVARIEARAGKSLSLGLGTAASLAAALGVRVDWLATGSLPERAQHADVIDLAGWRERRAR